MNMILKPAWKLLNFHLPVYSEVIGYRQDLKNLQTESGEDAEPDIEHGYESDDEEEVFGIEGMTLQLIELLTTLIARPNVQEVVRQGLNPMLTTVSSFMILPAYNGRIHIADSNHFIYDKDEAIFKVRTVRNSCVDLVS
jgi:hypothetical protein